MSLSDPGGDTGGVHRGHVAPPYSQDFFSPALSLASLRLHARRSARAAACTCVSGGWGHETSSALESISEGQNFSGAHAFRPHRVPALCTLSPASNNVPSLFFTPGPAPGCVRFTSLLANILVPLK